MALTFAQRQALQEQQALKDAEERRVLGATSTADQDRIMAEADAAISEPNQGVLTEAAKAAMADRAAANLITMPSEDLASNLPVSDPSAGPSISERLSTEIRETGSTDPIIKEIMNEATIDEAGQPSTVSRAEAEARLNEAMQLSTRRVMPRLNYNYIDSESLREQIPNSQASQTAYETVVTNGNLINTALENTFSSVMTAPENDIQSKEIRSALLTAGLITEGGTLSPAFGQIAGFQFLENIEKELVKRDKMVQADLDPKDSHNFSDDNVSELDMFEAFTEGNPISQPHVGMLLNPDYESQNIISGILDKALPAPDVVDGVRTGFGGASQQFKSEVLQAADALMWQAFDEAGFIEEVTDKAGNRTFYQYSADAVEYYHNARDVMNDVIPEKNTLPSTIPAFDGLTFGADRDLGFKRQGNISIKSIKSKGDNLEMEFMNLVGTQPKKVDPEMFAIGQRMVNSIITYEVLKNGGIVLNKKMPLANKPDGRMYSNNPYAVRLGLDKAVWDGHYLKFRRKGMSEVDAVDQANVIMGMKARKLAQDTHYGADFSNRKIYFRKLYASITGRYHDRNSILSPQQSKYVRNFITNAEPTFINLGKPSGEILRSFKWLIGRQLLTMQDTGGVRVEDMLQNEIVRLTDDKIFNDPQNYTTLVQTGQKIKELINDPETDINAGLELIDKEIGTNLANATNDAEEWGFLLGAYVDMANYDAANNAVKTGGAEGLTTITSQPLPKVAIAGLTSKKETPRAVQLRQLINDAQVNEDMDMVNQLQGEYAIEIDTITTPREPATTSSSVFKATVRGKFDQKQSGMAILSGLFGTMYMMKRVGMVYPKGSKSVIPDGDIRDLFMKKLMGTTANNSAIDIHFVNNQEKIKFWKEIFQDIKEIDPKALARALSRSPLMESSYGKPLIFNQETAMKFIDGPFGQLINERISMNSNMLPNYSKGNAIQDLTGIIAATLHLTLDFEAQQLMKDIGRIWSYLGNQNARFVSPTGKVVYVGSKTSVNTDKQISIPSPRGQIERPVTRIVPTSTARTQSSPQIYNPVTELIEKGAPTDHGQEVINQMLVVIIQTVDAAVKGMSYIIANRERVSKGLTPLFGIDIHDSSIVDVQSAAVLHRAYNRIMKEYTAPGSKQQFNILETGLVKPLSEGVTEWKKSINPKDTYEISEKSLGYRALHADLVRYERQLSEKNNEGIGDGLERYLPKRGYENKKALADMMRSIKAMGWKPEGAYLTGANLLKVVDAQLKYMRFFQRFTQLLKTTRSKNATNAEFMADEFGGFN